MNILKFVNNTWRQVGNQLVATSGSLIVEAVFIFSLVMALSIAVADYGLYLVKKARTEALNHSLAAVLRERKVFFNGDENLTQLQVNQIADLAKSQLGPFQASGFCLTVEMLTFKRSLIKQVAANTIYYGGTSNCRLRPKTRLTEAIELSNYSASNRWIPLYQVTLSVPMQPGTLNQLWKGVGILPDRFIVSNVVIPR